MKYVKWIFVVLLIGSLTSFVEKDKPTGGLNVGDIAPDFKIQSMSAGQPLAELSDMKGKYVLLSFWASYDAHSRMQNASLSNVLRSASRNDNVEMVSVSFGRGFTNYLLDENGVIIAKNISAAELSAYLN